MVRVELLYPSKYLRSADLQGKDVTLTIEKVSVDELQMRGGLRQKKPVVYFAKTEKMLVLNKTNAMTIAELYGLETDEWIGKQITIWPTQDRFGPDVVDCIRVRPTVPVKRISKRDSSPREPGAEG